MSDPIAPVSAPATSSAPASSEPALSNAPASTESSPIAKSTAAPVVADKAVEKKVEAARRLKLKVDKQEIELPEDEVIKLAQLGTASQKRFQEAAQQKKQAEDFFKMLKEGDLEQLLNHPSVGRDARKWAEEYLAKQLEAETLSPEQKEKRAFEEERRKFQDEKKQVEQQKQQEEQMKMQQQYAAEYDKQFTDCLATSGLPKTQFTVKRLANYMEQAIKDGLEDVTPADLVPLVRQDYMQEVSDLFGQTDGDALLQLLGDGVANKIRKADLARLKGPIAQAAPVTSAAPKEEPTVEAPKKVMNVHEWRAFMASKRNS